MTLVHGPWPELPERRSEPSEQDPEDLPLVKLPGKALVPVVEEAELVDEEPVDRPAGATVWAPPVSDRRPILPAWIADPDTRRAAARWAAGHVRYVAGFQASRLPVYAARAYDPRSIGRALARALRWASDPETTERLAGVPAGDGKTYAQLRDGLRASRQARRMTLGGAVVGLAGTEVALGFVGPSWDQPAVGLAALAALGVAGRRRDKPFVDHAVTHEEEAPRLTSTVVTDGLASIGVPELRRPDAVRFVAPVVRAGAGWLAALDLPHGVTVGDVLERRDKLASGLRRPLGCVWPEGDPDSHPGRLRLFVGDQPMSKAKVPPWPLARAGQVDIFSPVPFGHDQRGRLVTVPLIFESVLIGAKPRMGKTFSLRVLLLAAALDPSVELRVWELKGTGDLEPLRQVAYHYGSGADDETVEMTMLSLREVHAMLNTRAATIKGLPKAVCPENKVTRDLANRSNLGLHPLLFSIDECQELFTHPEYGQEAADLCTAVIKRGPALGITLALATQRPDAKSLPTGISSNAGVRFCLRVMGQIENDMVLGTSSYKAGIRASMFTRSDLGIGYLVGASDDPEIVRSAYLDGPAAERVALRARGLRDAAGTLQGVAVGDQRFDTGPDWSVVTDLLDVMPEDRAHSADLCARLAELRPSVYDGWDATTLAANLKACGVRTKQVRAGEDSSNGRGVVRAHLVEAADTRGLMA